MVACAVTLAMPERRRQAAVADVARRMLADVDRLVAEMGAAYQREIPEYAAMSGGQLAAEVLPMSRQAVTAFFSAFLRDGKTVPRDFNVFEDSGRTRLRMGVPLDSVLHAYRIAGRVTWNALVADIRPGEEALLGELAAGWIDFIDRASCVVARGYLAASHERMRHVDARRRELLEGLLSAADQAEVAAMSVRFSTVFASSYVPVVVAGPDAVGRIDAILDAAPAGALGGHRGDRVLLLVPDPYDDPAALLRITSAVVAYGEATPPGPALLVEVQNVEALAGVATRRSDAGVFGPDDLLVEQLVLASERTGRALRRRVADVLAARDAGGVLTSTLRTYLDCGSVPETARREVVHANTVGYRLNRIRELMGLDPRVPRDATLLVLGLTDPE